MPPGFEVSSPPVKPQKRSLAEDPIFASALASQSARGKSPRSGRDRRATADFQGGLP